MSTRQARKMERAAEASGSDDDAEELARQAAELDKAERKPKASGFAAMMM